MSALPPRADIPQRDLDVPPVLRLDALSRFQAEPARRVISELPLARRLGVLPVQRLNA